MLKESDPSIIAAWSAIFFGILEGIVLNISRGYPVLLAPYKLSANVLWIAPLLNFVLFQLIALCYLMFVRMMTKRLDRYALSLAFGLFLFLGLFGVISAPKLIYWISSAVFSLGLAVLTVRAIRKSERAFADRLRNQLYWLPVSIIVVFLGVFVSGRLYESLRFNRLPEFSEGTPNVLLIVMDTLRYDRFIRPEGHSLSPNLDQIAAQGIRFENAWPTTSWTLPSHASMLTGLYPHQHGADWPGLKLDPRYPTIQNYFAKIGYVTGAFSGNSAWVTPEYLGKDFLRFQVYTIQDFWRRTGYGRIIDKLAWELGFSYAGYGKKASQSNAEFLSFLDDYPDRPFFVLINYMDVNQAYYHAKLNHPFWVSDPPIQTQIEAYDNELQVLDQQIADLFVQMEKRGILNNTLVVITSDHGQSFGAVATDDHDPAGHGTSLYTEQLRVPLFMIFKGYLPAGEIRPDLFSLRQLPATIIDLVDRQGSTFIGPPAQIFPPQIELQEGINLLATLNYDEKKLRSVIGNGWQFINNLTPQKSDELYDLRSDPLEKENLAPTASETHLFREFLKKLLGD